MKIIMSASATQGSHKERDKLENAGEFISAMEPTDGTWSQYRRQPSSERVFLSAQFCFRKLSGACDGHHNRNNGASRAGDSDTGRYSAAGAGRLQACRGGISRSAAAPANE